MRSCVAAAAIFLFSLFLPEGIFAQAEEPVSSALVVDSGNRFGVDLFAHLKSRPGNLFFSPYSIATAMDMVYAGARGDTAREMAQVLYIAVDGDAWHKAVFKQMKEIVAARGCELTVANSLWGQKGYVFSPAYLSLIGEYYGGDLQSADFTQASAAAALINAWVSVKTDEKIKEIVSPAMFGPLTRLVLVNAVYFKGAWESPFKKIHTQNGNFYATPQGGKVVAMMHQLGHFSYTENDQVQVLELAYEGGDLSMVILLPKKADDLAVWEESFSVDIYKGLVSGLSAREVDVTLPKFKAVFEAGLAATMTDMGISEAFSSSADFSGMTDEKGGLQISDVVHKAFVDVTEEGTEAAAATAVVMREGGIAPDEPSLSAVSFVADHPFLYVIRDRRSDSILFMGRMADPDVGARAVGDVLGGVWNEVVGQALQAQKNIHAQAGDGQEAGK